MGQRRLSQLARTLLSREAESKYPPPKNKHTQKSHTHTTHTNRCEKNGEEIGSLLYYYSNPYQQQRHYPLYLFSNPNTNIQTTPFFSPSLSLPYAHFCVSIYFTDPLSLLPSIITPVLLPPSSSLRLISSPPASRWRPNEGVVDFNLV